MSPAPAARPPRVKFCGITRIEDADAAVSLGAWAIGLNLWAGSSRVVLPQEAADIADRVRRKVEIVGVFVNEQLDAVVTLAEEIGLTMIQLHGDEGASYVQAVARRSGCKVIKAARVRDFGDVKAISAFPGADFHLLDAYVPGVPGGSGASFDWELARRHRGRTPVILSGGLTPENVAEAVAVARPWAVDVASGIEQAPGIKDPARMEAFMAAVAPPADPATAEAEAEESAA